MCVLAANEKVELHVVKTEVVLGSLLADWSLDHSCLRRVSSNALFSGHERVTSD